MKKTARKLLASTLALSLMATSLPVIGSTTALAEEKITETTTVGKDLVKPIGQVDNPDGGTPYVLYLYCNDETGTAFTYCGHDIPNILKFLIDVSDTFNGYFGLSEKNMNMLSFSNAEIEEQHLKYVGYEATMYHIVNHGDITYTDEAGEAHTFTCMKDIEDYLIQNYPVTLLDIHEIAEEDLPWATTTTTSATTTSVTTTTTTTTTVTTGTTKEERDMTTSIGCVINPEGSRYEQSTLFLHYNEETETAFIFSGHDVPSYMKALILEPTTFDGTIVYTEAFMKYFSFPDADIKVWGDTYCVENHGTIIYTDENGKKHTFTCMKDAEDYVMQNYPTIPLDIHRIDESMFLNDSILFDNMESVKEYAIQNLPVLDTGKTDVTTNVPFNVLIGDVTMDGKVDLIDAICLNKICSNIIFASDMQKVAGDCDANGAIDDFDVTLLMEFCIGLQKKLPVTD